MDAVGSGEVGLAIHDGGVAQVVVAQADRDLRLIVPGEVSLARLTCVHLRESLAPPFIVLGNRVELRQVEGNGLRPRGSLCA